MNFTIGRFDRMTAIQNCTYVYAIALETVRSIAEKELLNARSESPDIFISIFHSTVDIMFRRLSRYEMGLPIHRQTA